MLLASQVPCASEVLAVFIETNIYFLFDPHVLVCSGGCTTLLPVSEI